MASHPLLGSSQYGDGLATKQYFAMNHFQRVLFCNLQDRSQASGTVWSNSREPCKPGDCAPEEVRDENPSETAPQAEFYAHERAVSQPAYRTTDENDRTRFCKTSSLDHESRCVRMHVEHVAEQDKIGAARGQIRVLSVAVHGRNQPFLAHRAPQHGSRKIDARYVATGTEKVPRDEPCSTSEVDHVCVGNRKAKGHISDRRGQR